MAKAQADPSVPNLLLAALPQKEYRRLLAHLEPVTLSVKEVLHEPHQPIQYVYFPESGLITKVVSTEDGACVEVAMTGREGMTGICLFFGGGRTSPFRAIVQVPGTARRMKAAAFEAEVRRNGIWTDLLLGYTHSVLTMVSQSAACNLLHDVEKRCCRWLLMAHDRIGSDEFSLTQEALALMLGVRRQSITEVARHLSRKRLISYRWGKLTILNRAGLEAASCGCYQLIRQYSSVGSTHD